MNEAAKELVSAAALRFGENSFTVKPNVGDPSADPGDVIVAFANPKGNGHCVEVVQRGNTFEVVYNDGEPPGPAEKLFVYGYPSQLIEVIEAVGIFLESIFSGRVIAYRERVGLVTRFLRRQDCSSLLWFASPEEVTRRKRRKIVAVYEWGTE